VGRARGCVRALVAGQALIAEVAEVQPELATRLAEALGQLTPR
jgi:hypothetical protein